MREETIGPFACVRVENTVQRFLRDGLWIDDVGHTFDTLELFQCFEKYFPCSRFAGTTWTNHHQTMIQIGNLIQLQHLVASESSNKNVFFFFCLKI